MLPLLLQLVLARLLLTVVLKTQSCNSITLLLLLQPLLPCFPGLLLHPLSLLYCWSLVQLVLPVVLKAPLVSNAIRPKPKTFLLQSCCSPSASGATAAACASERTVFKTPLL